MHMLLTPNWHTKGEKLSACNLPTTVLVVNVPPDYIDEELGDMLFGVFGYWHNGFDVQKLEFNSGRFDFPVQCNNNDRTAVVEFPKG